MTSTTPRGRKPADHQQKTARDTLDRDAERDALLADMPELVAPHKLRMRDRATLTAMMLDATAAGAFGDAAAPDSDDDDADDSATFEFDMNNPADVIRLKTIDALCVQIDEFAESLATDKDAYADWSGGKSRETFFAILSTYQEASGE